MNSSETLYFPDTAIFSERQVPLFLLFPVVNIVTPVEGDIETSGDEAANLMTGPFCHLHTPHPLGEDRDRFLYLINDIKNRKDDYAAQLSHITLASMSAGEQGDDAGHRILSTLVGRSRQEGSGAAQSEQARDEAGQEALWQARLVLKIGEMLDMEEEEVARALAFLEDSETELFDKLRGEGNDEADIEEIRGDLEKIAAKLDKPKTEAIAKRLLAWKKLTEGVALPDCSVWATTRVEAADILSENHEKQHGEEPRHIATIFLPAALPGREKPLVEELPLFHAATEEYLAPLVQTVLKSTEAGSSEASGEPALTEATATWQVMLDSRYPKDIHGRVEVRFTCFRSALANYLCKRKVQQPAEGAKVLATLTI